jgi:predicted DNA-binding transcriptional regulator YafY
MRAASHPASLPPVQLTPEEAAAVAVALATGPAGPWAAHGPAALEKVLTALEPDPARRAALLTTCAEVAGPPRPPAGQRPALVVLPGGRS